MALYNTPWQVSMGALSILNWDDCLTEECPKLIPRCAIQPVEPIRAVNSSAFPRGNLGWSLSFTRVVICPSPDAAWALYGAVTASVAALTIPVPSLGGVPPCVMQFAGMGGSMTLTNAVLAQEGYKPSVKANRFIASFELQGSALTYAAAVAPGNPHAGANWPALGAFLEDAPSFDAGAVTDEAGSPITDEGGHNVDS